MQSYKVKQFLSQWTDISMEKPIQSHKVRQFHSGQTFSFYEETSTNQQSKTLSRIVERHSASMEKLE
jgi:hypothetical protein